MFKKILSIFGAICFSLGVSSAFAGPINYIISILYSPESGSSVILGTQKETPNSVSLRLRRHILSSDIASGILKNGLHLDADACRNNRIVVSLRKRDYRYLIYKSKRTENDNDFSEIIQNKLQDLRHCTVGQIGITFTNRK